MLLLNNKAIPLNRTLPGFHQLLGEWGQLIKYKPKEAEHDFFSLVKDQAQVNKVELISCIKLLWSNEMHI